MLICHRNIIRRFIDVKNIINNENITSFWMLSAKHKGKKKENAFILIKKTTKLTSISREKYLD